MSSSNSYSSSSIRYNPNPPRVWSRVQSSCSVIAYKNDDPAANSNFARADYERQMLLKGNILQYKKNSSNLTKKQRYTQIAKGMWTNRTKTWATQSDTYSNPNMTSLLRVNSTILDPSNNTFSNRSNPFGCPTTTIQDGGNLVCNVVVNPCTQEVVKRTQSQQLCNPTTDSDVPGQIQQLCWNDGTQTWYPRQRYIMPTSGTKWPEGYKGFVSAVTFIGPELSVGTIGCGDSNIPLNWTFLDSTCIPITSFNIYQNDILILNVPVSQTSVTINQTGSGIYSFYVTSLSNDIESEKSNSVVVNTQIGYIITGVKPSVTYVGTTVTLLFSSSGISTFEFFCPRTSINLILVGGGGGGCGGHPTTGDNKGGGGGGGGETIQVTNPSISQGVLYSITIGSGGNGTSSYSTPGVNGASSYFSLGYTAAGGQGAQGSPGGYGGGYPTNGGAGGAVGNSTTPGNGGNGSTSGNSRGGGGGGGGAGLGTNLYGGAGGGVASNSIGALLSGGLGGPGGYDGNPVGATYGGGNGGTRGNNGGNGTFGGGGGGGGGTTNQNYKQGVGGNGGNGFCIIQFTYP